MELSVSDFLSERNWRILELRVGFGEQNTLDEVGIQLDLSRERIRQLQAKATKSLGTRICQIAPVLDTLEAHASELWSPFDDSSPLESATRATQRILVAAGWQTPSAEEVRRILTTLRALAQGREAIGQTQWPRLSFAACGLPPIILRHPEVAAESDRRQREDRERHRTWTYEELSLTVLREAQTPMHWREIAVQAEQLGHRANFSASSMFNALGTAPDLFARVSAGTYGLTEWGLKSVPFYPDVIAAVLHAAQKPQSYGAIFQAVNAVRPIKEGSLRLFLDQHARFYRSVEGTYGLRAWLPPRHKQTLRTPRWQVEDPGSLSRLDRAGERGYDVDGIVDEDRV